MGLDMYLYASKYSSDLSHDLDRVGDFYPKELVGLGKRNAERNFLSVTKEYQIGYWRKANAIHKFFVDNCADGEDNCKPMWVSSKTLQKLKSFCDDILKDKDVEKAKKYLPTTEGFFFGSIDYDDWYFDDLQYTSDLLGEVLQFLKDNPDYDITYEASW